MDDCQTARYEVADPSDITDRVHEVSPENAGVDGIREGIHMERIGGVTSTMGLWHTIRVTLGPDDNGSSALAQ